MSGECDECGNHSLDCDCPYTTCSECKGIIFKGDKICIGCLLAQTKKLIEDSENTFKTW